MTTHKKSVKISNQLTGFYMVGNIGHYNGLKQEMRAKQLQSNCAEVDALVFYYDS